MSQQVIHTDKAPQAIGAYSQAVRHGQTLYLSGQIPLDPATMELVEGFEAQTRQAFANMQAVLEAAGLGFDNVLKLTVLLDDLANFDTVNKVMAELFNEPYPARAAYAVKALPKGCAIEIEGIAGY